MSVPMLGHPALRHLALAKLRAVFRRQARRLRKPSGILFALVGLLLVGGWLTALTFSARERRAPLPEPEVLLAYVQGGLLMLFLVTVLSSVSAKGLYLPREDLERLLSGPVSRADLVRYRMQVDIGRSLFGAVVFALLVLGRMPGPGFAFGGVVLAMLTLAVARTAASLLVGAVRGRWAGLFGKRRLMLVRVALGVALWVFVMLLVFGEEFLGEALAEQGPLEIVKRVLLHPVAHVLLLPLRPWAQAITATTAADFALWGTVCVVLYVLSFELTARLPIDYREASIETSNDMARRLSSLRSQGGPFGGMETDAAAGERPIPWLLGRSPFGAVAWIQLAAIRRKARGTLLVSFLVVGLVTFFASLIARGPELQDALAGAGIIAVAGTVYLCSGLRFDFRSGLDRMEALKAWPLAPWRVFLATLLPEVLLASALLAAAILLRAVVTGSFHPVVLGVVALLPLLVLAWTSLDNAVFLLAPVRFVPGQEGALHHMGRTMLLVLLRLTLFLALAVVIGGIAFVIAFVGGELLALPPYLVVGLAVTGGVAALLLFDVALVAAGGKLLRRFDVSREVG